MRKAEAFAALVAMVLTMAAGSAAASEEGDGSRTRPVHRIALYDEFGELITPLDARGMPFSARETCTDCHDYGTIAGGWHFNSHNPNVPPGPAGEPWVVVDEMTGTQLPVSGRDWPGAWHPDALGMSPWRFTQLFSRHMPGGDWGEQKADPADPASRWNISGELEINCLGCHNQGPAQNHSDWVISCARENFRWAATASAGLGYVDAVASRVDPAWDIIDGPDLDNSYAMPPSVDYDARQFDDKFKVLLDVTRDAPADRCYFCHSTTAAGEDLHAVDGDVHMAAGLRCTDCHSNDLGHHIVRGGAADPGTNAATLSCRGCHLGDGSGEGGRAMGGRFGAPVPEHEGLPESHLEEMTCTACHSGPWPEQAPARVLTSRANRLGVHGKADWVLDMPFISAPVFMENEAGQVAPHKVFWPAFWARVDGAAVTPLLPEAVKEAAGAILDPEKQVADVLGALVPSMGGGVPVYVAGDLMYQRATTTTVEATPVEGEAASTPYWGLLKDGAIVPVAVDVLGWTVENMAAAQGPSPKVQIEKILAEIDYNGESDGDPVCVKNGKLYRYTDDSELVTEEPPEGAAQDEAVWADLTEDGLKPYASTRINELAQAVIDYETPLAGEALATVLGALAAVAPEGCQPVYVSGGKTYRRVDMEEPATVAELDAAPEPPGDVKYWAWASEEAIEPLVADYVTEALAKTLDAEQSLTKTQVALVLEALAAQDGAEGAPAYVCGGNLFQLDGESLAAKEHDAAKPYAWTLGHDVRPAAQSLGAGGCTDCHAQDAPFFYAQVAPTGPALVELASAAPMHALEGYDAALVKGWERSAALRDLTVYGGIVLGALIGIAVLHYAFLALETILRALVSRSGKE